MPRPPRRPGRKTKRARPPARRPRSAGEAVVTRARIAAAEAALAILDAPPGGLGAVELGRAVGAMTDRAIARVHEECGDGHRVACRVGCTYCCMVPVAASAPEVLAIAAFVRERFDDDRREALERRVEANIAATEGLDMAGRDRLRMDCPFLEGGRCSVYEARPIACRGYSSYRVEECREDYERPGTGVEGHANALRELVHGAIREGLAVACRSAEAEHRPLELVRAYRIASGDPTLAETWRRRPLAFAPALGERVFPGPWSDELNGEFEEVYREARGDLERRASDRPPGPRADIA